jgi:two-component system, CitB family, sensor kinase
LRNTSNGRRWSLAGQLFALQLVLVVIALLASGLFWLHQTRVQLDRQYEQRVLAVAESVATLPAVREAFDDPDPSRTIAPLVERIRQATDASFISVANDRQIRYSHPDPAKIGEPLSTDASDVLTGHPWTGVQTGTTGRSVRAKVPVLDESGRPIGVVSVGIAEANVAAEAWRTLPELVATIATLVVVGAGATYLIARRMRRQTYGLAASEIGTLLDHRVAMLHALKEGVVAFDPSDRITLVNDEARRLLDLPADVEGRRLDDLDLPERLHDVLAGRADGSDEIVLRRGRVLALNRMPVRVAGRRGGSVVTLRDRTQLDELARELDGARTTTDALRVQAHEFYNQIYTIAGLLELGEHDEARTFVTELSAAQSRFADELTDKVRDPAVAALLLAKSAAAREHGAELQLGPDTDLDAMPTVAARKDLLLVVGNLIDNALESLPDRPGWVRVRLGMTASATSIEVADSGPGVAPEIVDEVFRAGFTTKVAKQGGQRGLGLALVRQTCRNRGGWVRVRNDAGAVFTASLPIADHEPDSVEFDRSGR